MNIRFSSLMLAITLACPIGAVAAQAPVRQQGADSANVMSPAAWAEAKQLGRMAAEGQGTGAYFWGGFVSTFTGYGIPVPFIVAATASAEPSAYTTFMIADKDRAYQMIFVDEYRSRIRSRRLASAAKGVGAAVASVGVALVVMVGVFAAATTE
jgi:hypothetical protein